MDKVDARGMSCPEPVIMTKNALEKNPAGVDVLVDNNVSVENITRFAENSSYKVEVENSAGDFLIHIKK